MKKLLVALLVLLLTLLPWSATAVTQEALSESYFEAAFEAYTKEKYAEAERLAKLGLSEVEKLKDKKAALRLRVKGLNTLSAAQIEQGKYEDAEIVKREEIKLLQSIPSSDYPEFTINYPMSLDSLGLILLEQRKFEESDAAYREALAYREKVYGSAHKSIATSLINLGGLYFKQNKYSEAEVVSKRAFSILGAALEGGELVESDTFMFIRAVRNLALINVERKNFTEAERQYKSIISLIERLYGRQDASLIEPLEEYARLLRSLKRPVEATRVEARIKQLKAVSN